MTEGQPSKLSRIKGWAEDLDTWKKVLGGFVGIVVALWVVSGWIDAGIEWYLLRTALAGELREVKGAIADVKRGQKLSLQKQEIDLSREINGLERAERAGRLSPPEENYLNIIRWQREQVRGELKNLPVVIP